LTGVADVLGAQVVIVALLMVGRVDTPGLSVASIFGATNPVATQSVVGLVGTAGRRVTAVYRTFHLVVALGVLIYVDMLAVHVGVAPIVRALVVVVADPVVRSARAGSIAIARVVSGAIYPVVARRFGRRRSHGALACRRLAEVGQANRV